MSVKERFSEYIDNLQDEICSAIEQLDGRARFREDLWERAGGGGGRTRVIENGRVFEKGGVNISRVHGELPEPIRKNFNVDYGWFWAGGLSLVIHPENPMVPTVHANYRYFELYEDPAMKTPVDGWFGGGADLTPYYLWEADAEHFHKTIRAACDKHGEQLYPRFKKQCDDYCFNTHRGERRGVGGIVHDYRRDGGDLTPDQLWEADAEHFHQTIRAACDKHGEQLYPRFKKQCDDYFFNTHRGERRGVGGIFYDYLREGGEDGKSLEEWYNFSVDAGNSFLPAYLPIAEKRMDEPWNPSQRYWQEIRRGRYVEFNLIHDRGTLFGLKSNGRIESIFMSLPPRVRWDYNFTPSEGSAEENLLKVLRNPKEWT